jgi:hypothetical protein
LQVNFNIYNWTDNSAKSKYIRAPLFTDSVPAVCRGLKKFKIEEIKGS